MSEQWRARLAPAFEVLLGAPLSSYPADATYATFAWGNFIREAELDRLPDWLDPAVLRGDKVLVNMHLGMHDEGPLRIDAAGSLFDVPPAYEPVEGRDLPLPPPDGWRVGYIRLASDGTLFDAMRAATQVGDGPKDLFEFDDDADEEWDEALAEAGVDEELRAHLRWCCGDGTTGITYFGADEEARAPRGTVLASWEDQNGQWDMVVVRL
ncbi:hypothetical protein ACFO1B_12880 [Dactylosporangium siamense]|uniref:DUF1963 domain-containing protein n=1 Tax=Dactylosporangium siamense TaxID=685454 RepID=A0A919UB63_9ACTN|nr:hypothetical protein [Dactylosporangium siamense]GIG49179.1 hypothetical protein Dsi01nite_072200 [Dactylosporangium siamense]